MNKILHILTGPPGSGKTTYANALKLPIYEKDLGNKRYWLQSPSTCILCTAAPTRENKEYWLNQAAHYGFQGHLVVMWVPRHVAMERMLQRSGATPTQQNNINKSVEQWYRLYQVHPNEQREPND